MRLLTRIAVIWIVLGLLTGLVLRTRKPETLGWLLALGFAPWLFHVLYCLLFLGLELRTVQLALFLGISGLLTLLAGLVAKIFASTRSTQLAALPLFHGIVYSLFLFIFARIYELSQLGLNTISWTVFGSGILFVTSLLFSYLLRFPGGAPSSFNPTRFSLKRPKK
ncbi:MAG: hypothetical protein ACRCYY_06390 [Trueperaceae bacterium]